MLSKLMLKAGLGALFTALLLWPAFAQQTLSITIARIGGTVEVQHATETKGAWVKAKKDQVIGAGWNLRTAASSKAQLVFPRDNVVILKENSVLTVDKLDATGSKVNAKSGGLLADIKNALAPGSTFEVQTPTALAVVRGTKFGVEVGGAASAGNDSYSPWDTGNDDGVIDNPLFESQNAGGVGKGGDKYEQQADRVASGLAVELVLDSGDTARYTAVEWGDLDGDGVADIALLSGDGSVVPAGIEKREMAGGKARVLAGQGFDEQEAQRTGDLDGDGIDDYFVRVSSDQAAASMQTNPYWQDNQNEGPAGDTGGAGGAGVGFIDAVRTAREKGMSAAEQRDAEEPAQISAMENPLAKGSEWTSGKVSGELAAPGDGTGGDQHPRKRPGRRVAFHGYEGTVEIVNDKGTSFMTEGTSVIADSGAAPSEAAPSGDDAQEFLEDAEDTAELDAFDAAAEAISVDLGPIRAQLEMEDRQLRVIENEWEGHVRRQDSGKLMLIFGQLEEFVELNAELEDLLWDAVGDPAALEYKLIDVLVSSMQERGVPDTDLPVLLDELNQRIADLLVDLEPYIDGKQELLDRLQGLLDQGDPRASIRNDLLDTDNDGVPDGLELELGLDPALSDSADGFVELVAPDDSEEFVYPPDGDVVFEFVALETDTPVAYNLVLEAGGQQAVRRNVRESERFTLAQLAGPGGLLADAARPDGTLVIDWYIDVLLRNPRGGPVPQIRSATRRFEIVTPANAAVEVSLRGSGAARLGSPVVVIGDISEVNALGEWEIEVEYDPQFLQFTQGNRTGLFSGSTVFFNDAGSGRLTVSGQVPAGSAGLAGDGDIFTLSFTPLAAGETEVEVARVTLRDTLGRDIEGRPGDSAELNIARGGSSSPTVPAPAGPGGPPHGPVVPGTPAFDPLLLSAPSNGGSFSYPADSEIEFEFDELRGVDAVYNLIISSGGKSRKFSDYASGDPVALAPLFGTGGIFAGALAGGATLRLDWRIEAEVDLGGATPLKHSSEARQLSIGGPRNSSVTLDLSAIGKTTGLQPGDPVRVRGSISQIDALGEFHFEVRFDSGVLEFDNGKRVGLLGNATVRVESAGPGKVVISGNAGGTGISGDGDVFELTFTARADGMAVIEPSAPRLSDILGTDIDGGAGDEVEVEVLDPKAGGGGAAGGRDPFAQR